MPLMPYDPKAHGARCDECPLKGSRVVVPEGDSPIVIVGDSPGKAESEQGRPFAGPAGFKLNELLRKAGLPGRDGLHLTNALLCRPEIPDQYGKKRYDVKGYLAWLRKENVRRKKEDHAPPLNNPFDCCAPRLKRELREAEKLAQEAHAENPSQFPTGAIVFPVGNFALAQTMGVEKRGSSVMKYRGSVIRVEPIEEKG
jgi:hypothetical protein